MQSQLKWMDQTLEEIYRFQEDKNQIKKGLKIIQAMGAAGADVTLSSWLKHQYPIQPSPFLRCRVKDVDEAMQAVSRGFNRITLPFTEYSKWQQQEECCVDWIIDFKVSLKKIRAATLHQVILEDLDSQFDPFQTYEQVFQLTQHIGCNVEYHGHNRCGLATANALAALEAGASQFALAIGGSGTYGHGSVEELLVAGAHKGYFPVSYQTSLTKDCAKIFGLLGFDQPVAKAILGTKIFQHESGLHVDGVSKYPALYETFRPEEVGAKRSIVIGKHSGTSSLKHVLKLKGIFLTDLLAEQLLQQVRHQAMKQKGPLKLKQLLKLYREVCRDSYRLHFA